MATESHTGLATTESTVNLKVEYPIYGSSRVGIKHYNNLTLSSTQSLADATVTADNYSRILGSKNYELSNHLGNVLTTISDRKIAHDGGSGVADYYVADVTSAQDYYPFGMIMPGRSFSTPEYRFGYQGSEKDREVTNSEGSHITTYYREGDVRIARWWSVDPVIQPWQTTFSFMDNSPMWKNDVMGDKPGGKDGPKFAKKHKKDKEEKQFIANDGSRYTQSYLDKLQKRAEKLLASERPEDKERGEQAQKLLADINAKLDIELDISNPSDGTKRVRNMQNAMAEMDAQNAQPKSDEKAFAVLLNEKTLTIQPNPPGYIKNGARLTIYNNGKVVHTQVGGVYSPNTFKVGTSDQVKINLSRVQPDYLNVRRSSPQDFFTAPVGDIWMVQVLHNFSFRAFTTFKTR